MTDSSSEVPSVFYLACYDNDLKKAQENITPTEVNKTDVDGNTVLHIASSKGFIELVLFLLRYHASRTIQNNDQLTAEEIASTKEIKELFKGSVRPMKYSGHFIAKISDVEWLDTYKNAYRISYENHEHMKRWLLKVPLEKLFKEIDNGYIDVIEFKTTRERDEVKGYIQDVIEVEDPLGLILAYTSATVFCSDLNVGLADVGSNFRFLSTQNLFNSGYLDNEAPKGLGQHIFASILINHSRFFMYHHTGITYRGMNITLDDLKEYEKNNIVMTRTFLSTSEDRNVTEFFIGVNDCENHPPVICIYKVTNPRSSLSIHNMSKFSLEKEVLIVPFVVFEVKERRDTEITRQGKSYPMIEIELEECTGTPTVDDLSSWNNFYKACCHGDINEVRNTITLTLKDKTDDDGNTVLHKASSNGYTDIVHLLLRHNASRTILNKSGKTAEDVALTEEIKELVHTTLQSDTEDNHFVATISDIEWLDTYENAHRIAYENYENMKRWLLKVPLQKLLNEMYTGYIDKIEKLTLDQRKIVKDMIKKEIPAGLLKVYTYPGLPFHDLLNHDLAEIGSNFRFLSTQNLFKYGYLDNEPPKELDQHIFASILINHSFFQSHQYTGSAYRGMNITLDDLKEYEWGHIVMTRSFLSTSKLNDVPLGFLNFDDKNKPAVMCFYTIRNPRSSFYIRDLSKVPEEDEVLILPFVVFKVIDEEEIVYQNDKRRRIIKKELKECEQNPQSK